MNIEALPTEKLINKLCTAAARAGVENSGLVIPADYSGNTRMRKYALEIKRRLDEAEELRIELGKARAQVILAEHETAKLIESQHG